MFLRSCSNSNYKIIWFDIETTGFNIFQNSIIEIAAIDNQEKKFQSLISYDKPLPKKIIEITKITDEMLYDQPNIVTVLKNFVDFIKSDQHPNKITYMIGHNINCFDIPFVKAQCAKYGIKFPKIHTIDTMRMSQYILATNIHTVWLRYVICLVFVIVMHIEHLVMYIRPGLFMIICVYYLNKNLKSVILIS